MTCEHYRRAIEAYVDGECPVEVGQAVEAHIRTCPDCRHRVFRLTATNDLVRRTFSTGRAPDDLWPRIASRLGRAGVSKKPDQAGRGRRSGRAKVMFVATVLVTMVAGAFVLPLGPQTTPERMVVHETIQDLVTFDLSERPFDISTRDPVVIHAWFDGKLRFQLPSLQRRAAGYELIGSRLCWLFGQRIGAVTYQRGDQLMTLYVIPGDAVSIAGGNFDPVLGTTAVRSKVANYASLVWRRGDFVFSLVSDAPDETMTAFAASVFGGTQAAYTKGGNYRPS